MWEEVASGPLDDGLDVMFIKLTYDYNSLMSLSGHSQKT